MESNRNLKVRLFPALHWFSALLRLTIPSHVVLGNVDLILSMVFSRNLERLRIVDAEFQATRYATAMVKEISGPSVDALPNLKEIELYCKEPQTSCCTPHHAQLFGSQKGIKITSCYSDALRLSASFANGRP
jgi:hypothetical protein